MRNFKNLVVVPDPKQHESLAHCLRFALEDSRRAEEIGRRGANELNISTDHQKYLDQFEMLLTEVAAEKPVTIKEAAEVAVSISEADQITKVLASFPFTNALLGDEQRQRLKETIDRNGLENPDDSSDALLSFLNTKSDVELPVHEVCRYEALLREWEKAAERSGEVSRYGLTAPIEQVNSRFPYLKGKMNIVQFECDVQAVISAVEKGLDQPGPGRPIRVLFHSASPPMRINDSTEHLLRLLADGAKTADEVFETLVGHQVFENANTVNELKSSYFSVLEELYWQGIIEFGPDPQASAVTAV